MARQAGPANTASGDAPDDLVTELVTANHVLAMLGLVDAFGHISVRHPDNPDHYLMARGVAPALVGEADILRFDLDSAPVAPSTETGSIERFIHGAIYKARPDVQSVVHTHSPRVIPFSVGRTPLRPISHTGAFLLPEVPIYDARETVRPNNFMIASNELGDALAAALGDNAVVLLPAHGDVVVAASIGLAVYRAYFTDKTAELLMQALQLDGPIRYVQEDEAALVGGLRDRGYVRQWDLWKRQVGMQSL